MQGQFLFIFFMQETSLADLLQLNLHCFEEDVKGIVDKAVKEMGMEKVLSELNSTWRGKGVWQKVMETFFIGRLKANFHISITFLSNLLVVKIIQFTKYLK